MKKRLIGSHPWLYIILIYYNKIAKALEGNHGGKTFAAEGSSKVSW